MNDDLKIGMLVVFAILGLIAAIGIPATYDAVNKRATCVELASIPNVNPAVLALVCK